MVNLYLVEVKTIEPVTITSNKGKSKFVDTLRYIPASSILGGIARKALIENVTNKLGLCSKIRSPNVLPNCDECAISCVYKTIWKNKNVKLTNALPGEWDLNSPSIPDLQSVGVLREDNSVKKDLLLCLFIEQEELNGKIEPKILLSDLRSTNYKRRPSDVIGTEIAEEPTSIVQLGRVSIDEKFKTSKKGELYGFTAIKEGQKFRFMILADNYIEKYLSSKIKVGAWKTRGMGLVEMKIIKKLDYEKYVEIRSKQILEGFEKISKILNEFVDGWFGTYTFLTHAIKKPKLEIKFTAHRTGIYRRFERSYDNSYFVLRNVIFSGSAGVFSVVDPEKSAEELARIELKFSCEPWHDWIIFNHPVHYEKSSIGVS